MLQPLAGLARRASVGFRCSRSRAARRALLDRVIEDHPATATASAEARYRRATAPARAPSRATTPRRGPGRPGHRGHGGRCGTLGRSHRPGRDMRWPGSWRFVESAVGRYDAYHRILAGLAREPQSPRPGLVGVARGRLLLSGESPWPTAAHSICKSALDAGRRPKSARAENDCGSCAVRRLFRDAAAGRAERGTPSEPGGDRPESVFADLAATSVTVFCCRARGTPVRVACWGSGRRGSVIAGRWHCWKASRDRGLRSGWTDRTPTAGDSLYRSSIRAVWQAALPGFRDRRLRLLCRRSPSTALGTVLWIARSKGPAHRPHRARGVAHAACRSGKTATGRVLGALAWDGAAARWPSRGKNRNVLIA